ncbi:MAG TPA: sigma-70 family RNA polymerase sigma factor [Pirellulales bacterium]|jgi:RNA polymerase sigma-70 factor (ECF subfamily)|nr:sigma-70 family RNA polymerase sigma factor [Pirellulales bacterium]
MSEHAFIVAERTFLEPTVAASRPASMCGEQTLAALVEQHYAYLSRFVDRLLGWSGDANDIVQDVFLTALNELPRFRGECQMQTWLTQIAINRCRALRRRRLLGLTILNDWRARRLAREEANAEVPLVQQERAEQVRQAVRRLPHRDREVIVLHYLEDMAVADLARILGLHKNAVEARLSRARKRLAGLLPADLVPEAKP